METLRASAKRVSRWLPWLALGAALATAWAWTHGGIDDIVPSVAAEGGSVLLLYVAVAWGRWRELARAAIVASLGVVGWAGARLSTGWLPGVPDTIGAGGVALLLLLVWRARTRGDEDAGDVARLGLALVLLTPTALVLAVATIPLRPEAWDATALAIDAAFPIHAFHVGRALERWPWLRPPADLTYSGIFALIPALIALRLRLPKRPATDLVVVSIVACLLGQLGYYATPIVGPAFSFGREFPDTLPNVAHLPMTALPVPPFLRNGMPSIHTTWALIFLWNTRPLSRAIRALGVAVVVFTVVATLGFGQHFVIDLVAAVPYAALCQALGTHVPPERRAGRAVLLAGCAALAGLWIAAPHFAWRIASVAPWSVVGAAVLTVVGASLGERWLSRAAG